MERGTVIRKIWLSLLLASAAAPTALAGGFYLEVSAPGADRGAYPPGTVLLVKPFGCHQPSAAALSATAEGVIDGRRKSLPLELREVEKGLYAIRQQWPAEGLWVVVIHGAYRGADRGVLVRLAADGRVPLEEGATPRLKQASVVNTQRKVRPAEIDAALGSGGDRPAKAAIGAISTLGVGVAAASCIAVLGLSAWRSSRH